MKIIVIGGGASGMAAALTAARKGAQVCILEKQPRVGRKLLATGNGRCNLTNTNLSIEHYHGQDADFAKAALTRFDTEKTLEFFNNLGLITTCENSGRVYPLSDQAGSVLDVLRLALDEKGVEVRTECEVTAIKKEKNGFAVMLNDGMMKADKVIVCCGGMACGKLGGTQSGYELLKSMGHTMTKLYPVLVQVKTDTTFIRALKGVRADARVVVEAGGKVIAESQGEVQFTETGVSGPAVFEVSRAISTSKQQAVIRFDLLRDLDLQQTIQLLKKRRNLMPNQTTENFLTGILHNRLGRTVLRYAGYGFTDYIKDLKNTDIELIAAAIKNFETKVSGVAGFENAQVTAGGISTADFNPETMESRLVKGLYAAGEVLDIDGDCGGYNLQWAWASGITAAENACKL
ncbi:MAG: NAD(P)/FAD-dependent oxidoreductase [Oscillospiraceae bacterium]|nr:NAD(P)/FAD-dependent oxidoreductase [Oscillospiraceae bacterium]